MYQNVYDRFPSFTTTFEGRVPWMYVDVKGLVTTGVGNLVDPVAAATALSWQHADGSAATIDEITAAWEDLKANRAVLGAQGHLACRDRNDLRLTDEAVDTLVGEKLASNESVFAARFPGLDSWPADAQLASMSMCWALGPAFAPAWPSLSTALDAGDFAAAASQCHISEVGNPGVAPRNVADVALFTNAAAVAAGTADPEVVYYPGSPPSSDDATDGSPLPQEPEPIEEPESIEEPEPA